jgi:hypothetical protein
LEILKATAMKENRKRNKIGGNEKAMGEGVD